MLAPITLTQFHISLEIVRWEMARACCENKKRKLPWVLAICHQRPTDDAHFPTFISFFSSCSSSFDEYFRFVHLTRRRTNETKRVNNEYVHEQSYLLFILMDMDELSTPNVPPLSLRRSIYGFRHYCMNPINFTELKRNECKRQCCW